MLTYKGQQVWLQQADRESGLGTVRLADGRFRVVPLAGLTGSRGGAMEVAVEVRRCVVSAARVEGTSSPAKPHEG